MTNYISELQQLCFKRSRDLGKDKVRVVLGLFDYYYFGL